MSLYKYSQFNLKIATNDNNETYIYNTYSSAGLWIASYDFKEILDNNKIDIGDVPEVFVRKGIIVPAEVDEVQRVINKYTEAVNDVSTLYIDVVLTLNCNYSCKYCFEHNVLSKDTNMPRETADQLIYFIKEKVDYTKCKYVSLKYYGGEPLLNLYILSYIANSLSKIGIILRDVLLITNGRLLTEKNIEVLKQSKIDGIQVTIDGMSETNALQKGCRINDFEIVVNNIESALKIIPNIQLNINATEYNKNEIIKLLNYLYKVRELNITSCITAVDCYTDNPQDTDYISDDSFLKLITEINDFKKENTVKVSTNKYYGRHCIFCNAQKKNHFTINHNGEIYRCERAVGNREHAVGNIAEHDVIKNDIWTSSKIPEKCLSCSVLPVCMGECITKRELDNISINCDYIINQIKQSIL